MDLSVERERLILWLPVAFGSGIALYFALAFEPARWIGPWTLLLIGGFGFVFRRQTVAVLMALALGMAALGFTLAVERTARLAHPVLERSTGIVALEGRVIEIEPVDKGFRLLLDQVRVERVRVQGEHGGLERVRIRVSSLPQDIRPGQRVALRAGLSPPAAPASPGAYDFARAAWFQELGAVGFAIGPPVAIGEEIPADGWADRVSIAVNHVRLALTERIRSAIDGAGFPAGTGSTAAAIVTAERGPIPPAVLDAYRNAGLAHILVIAGMHMSMVAGLVFVAIRAGLALFPGIALNYPIKKWAAAAALMVALGYLIVSGAPVPTQRAFIMNGIVLGAVLLDRDALSLRSIGWAAIAVLAFHPEALVGPSFQMSFAAVYGLISAYEVAGPRLGAWRRSHSGWWRGPALYAMGILLTTQVAGTATALYTVYHFDRYATYSLLGNILAVPVVGFWVMPAALLAFLLMPLGLDYWGWVLMGKGIALVSAIGAWVSGLPGAVIDVPRMPVVAVIVFTAGGFWLVLWRRRIRLWGLAPMVLAFALWAAAPTPDILVDPSGRLVAVKSADGSLSFSQRVAARRSRLAWARQAGQGEESPKWDEAVDPSMRCDSLGCVRRIGQHAMAFAKRGEALADDCRMADLVVVPVPYAGPCPSAKAVIDGFALRDKGAHAVWILEKGYRIETVASWQGKRPWSPFAANRKTLRAPKPAQEAEPEINSAGSVQPDVPEP